MLFDEMTITLDDVFMLVGISVMGRSVSTPEDCRCEGDACQVLLICIFIIAFSYLWYNKHYFLIVFLSKLIQAFTKGVGRENESKSLLKFRLNQKQG